MPKLVIANNYVLFVKSTKSYKDLDATLFKWCWMIDGGHKTVLKVAQNNFYQMKPFINCVSGQK